MRDEQAAFADELLEELNIKGKFTSILKRDSLDEFVEGVVKKSKRNNYAIIGEMDDMSRGRFNLESWDMWKLFLRVYVSKAVSML